MPREAGRPDGGRPSGISGYTASVARAYSANGWHPLPLLDNAKGMVPTGFTGYAARRVQEDDIDRWGSKHDGSNLCLRLMDEVGLDFDNYRAESSAGVVRQELGDAEQWLKQAEKELGPLPPTVIVGSRLNDDDYDGQSGIMLYRLPKEVAALAEVKVWNSGPRRNASSKDSDLAPGVDLIRLGHRQVVVWPSHHPKRKSQYAWAWTDDPANVQYDVLPPVTELPELPVAWCSLILKKAGREALGWEESDDPKEKRSANPSSGPSPFSDEEVYSEHWSDGEPCDAVTNTLQTYVERMETDSRYNSVRDGVLALTRLGEQGHHGVLAAVSQLRHAYRDAIGDDRDTDAEWERMCAGLDDIVKDDPTDVAQRGCCVTTWVKPVTFRSGEEMGGKTEISRIDGLSRNDPSDLAMALWFLREHRERCVYVTELAEWLVWDGVLWRGPSNAKKPTEAVSQLLSVWICRRREELAQEARQKAEDNYHSTHSKPTGEGAEKAGSAAHAAMNKALTSAAKHRAVLAMVEVRGPALLSAPWDSFDPDPTLLNCPNGVVNLRTGALLPHDPQYRMTMVTRAEYRPTTKAPTFLRMLEEAQPDPAVRGYLQRRSGYALLGEQLEHRFFIDHGEAGRNGKGVLHTSLTKALGGYATVLGAEKLMVQANDPHPEWLVRLRGKRYAWIDEAREQRSFDTARVKMLTGGSPRECRELYGSTISYDPADMMVLSTNRLPKWDGGDSAMGSRLSVLKWTVTFAGREDNTLRGEILGKELEGVLAWAVEGCVDYLAKGLDEPLSVAEDTTAAHNEANPVWEWVEQDIHADEDATVTVGALFMAYQLWFSDHYPGQFCMTHNQFARTLRSTLERKGIAFTKKKMRTGPKSAQGFAGIRLVEDRVGSGW